MLVDVCLGRTRLCLVGVLNYTLCRVSATEWGFVTDYFGCLFFFFPMLDHRFVFFFSIAAQLCRGVFLETRKQTLMRQMLGKTGAGPLSTQWTSGRGFSKVQSGEKVDPRAPSPLQTRRRSQPRR